MGRFIGRLHLEDLGEQQWKVLVPFGYLLCGKLYVVMPGTKTNGTSLPWPVWTITRESPMAGSTKYSAVIHDAGYAGCILILDTVMLELHHISPEKAVVDPMVVPSDCFVHYDRQMFPRKHWDDVLEYGWRDAATYGCGVDRIPRFKREVMIAFVRAFGWIPWRKYAKSHR